MAQSIVFHWEPSSFSGWGVYGLNLALHWSADPEVEPVCSWRVPFDRIAVDPVRWRLLQRFFQASAKLHEDLQALEGPNLSVDAPIIHSLSNSLYALPGPGGASVFGKPTIGAAFFETAALDASALDRARMFALIVAGSTWNAGVLKAAGIDHVATVLQGVDPTVFHPAPRSGLMNDRFLVFSGGKIAYRKAQDIVVAAFRIFAERHDDALLVTAWHSPWPRFARSVDQSKVAAPIVFGKDDAVDVVGWAAANGIAADRVVDLGEVANSYLPAILREMDVAVFPNRCEGGTNLVAMECMACGVPVILSRNTGHLDLIDGDNCFVLDDQRPIASALTPIDEPYESTEGWGESSVEELVALLERAYGDRSAARARGEKGAATMACLTWAETARRLKSLVLALV